jgi:hypothetical protein
MSGRIFGIGWICSIAVTRHPAAGAEAAAPANPAELLIAGPECLDPAIREDFASWLH